MKTKLLALLILACKFGLFATNFTVTNNLDDTNTGSLRAAIIAANADNTATVGSPHTITTNAAYTISLTSVLPDISKPINLNSSGSNYLTIDANNGGTGFSASALSVANSTSGVKLNYIIIQNAFRKATSITAITGAGLYIGTTCGVEINYCKFLNNIMSTNGYNAGCSGAALYINSGASTVSTVSINDSWFEGNNIRTNISGSTPALSGVSIYSNTSSSVTVTNTTFKSNSATIVSPATAISGGSNIRPFGNISFTDCTFDSNTTAGAGSVVLVTGQTNTIAFDKCTIANNSGGINSPIAIGVGSSTPILNISNSIINGNSCTSPTYGGGAIYAQGANVTITNSQISTNTACQGGAIFLQPGSATYKTKLIMTGCTVSGNSTNGLNAAAIGGGICVKGNANNYTDDCTFTNCTFSGNTTSAIGGTVTTSTGGGVNFGNGSSSAWVAKGIFNNCTIIGNSTAGNATGDFAGGGLTREGTAGIILNYCIIAGNSPNSTSGTRDLSGSGTLMGSATGRNLIGSTTSTFSMVDYTVTTGNVTVIPNVNLPNYYNATLADNGGTTTLPDGSYVKTHALVSGSAAINPTAASSGLQTTDQRGKIRDTKPDIGAFEAPSISFTGTVSAFTNTYGTASAAQTFAISGTNLISNITATAPTGFEVSSNGSAYGSTAAFTQSGGSASGTLNVRLAANAAAGASYNSINIVLSGTGATSTNITTLASGNTVSKKELSITGTTFASKVYDGITTTGAVTPGTLSGFFGSETVTISSATGVFIVSANAGDGKTASITYTLADGINGGLASNYSLANSTVIGNVTPKPLIINAPAIATKVYDGSTTSGTVTPGTLSGFVDAETVTIATAVGTYPDTNVGTGKTAIIAYTLANGTNGGLAANYSLPNGSATGDIIAASGSPIGDNLNNSGLTDNQLANTNLTINTGEFIINDTKTVRSLTVAPGAKLTHSSGTLTATNGITLESDASGTATLMDSYTEPTITATVKQYVTAGRNWYISAPLNNTADYSVLDKGASVAEYNEETGLWPTVSSGTLTRGKGYVQVASSGQGTTGTVSFNGTINSGNVPVTLTNTLAGGKGFNLVGNPYPSYISWSAVAADNAAANMPTGTMWYRTISYNGKSAWAPSTVYSVNDIVYNGTRFYKVTTAGTSAASGGPTGGLTGITDGSVVWNYEGSIYLFATISASGVATPATVSNLVPPMQAFWVKSTGGTLTFKNTMRLHNTGGANALKAPKNVASDIKLLRLNVSNGASADEAVIYSSNEASNAFDTYDAPKYFNTTGSNQPEIYTQVGNEKLVINAMSEINQGTEIPLGFATEKGNNFSISASEFRNFGSDTKVLLKDKQTTAEFDLTSGQSYSFSSGVVNDINRFSLIFRTAAYTTGIGAIEKPNAQVFINAANQITIIAPVKSNYAIYNALGMMIENGILTNKLHTINCKLNTGVYVVKVNNLSTRVIVK